GRPSPPRARPRPGLRRAAELLGAGTGDPEALALHAELLAADPGDVRAERALERLRLGRDDAALVAQLERAARARPEARAVLLRRAAAVAESRLGDVEAAARLAARSPAADLPPA